MFGFTEIYAEAKDSMAVSVTEIKVEAGRLNAFKGNKFSPVVTLEKSKIRESGCLQVNEAISEIPGLYIKNFGGIGGIKIVSLRGTTSQQTVYMLDGIRINSAQTGAVDLSVIPLFMLESVDVVRGGSSALYGGNSLGGVINFATGTHPDRAEISTNAVYGSFGEAAVSCGMNIPAGDWYAGANIEYLDSKGDFPFEFNNFGKVSTFNRQNSDFRNLALMLNTGMNDSNSALKINFLARDSERGIPGAVLQNKIGDEPDRLRENEILASANYFRKLGGSYLSVSVAGKSSGSDYHSPKSLGYLSEIEYLEKYFTANAKYGFTLCNSVKTELQSEAVFNDINYDYSGEIKDYRKRTTLSLSVKGESDDIVISNEALVSFQGGLRYDYYSEPFSALSPVLSAMASAFGGRYIFRLQWAHNFRPPNFSEMYYHNFGNRNLKPEKSDAYNLGVTLRPFGFLLLSADGFVIDTRDQIQSVPVSPVVWSATNFARTLSKGVELSAVAVFFADFLSINFNYTYQETTDESPGSTGSMIPYVPGELLNAGISIRSGDISAGINSDYTGFRYSLPGNNLSSVLQDYMLVNAFASYIFGIDSLKLKLRFDILNIFAEEYQVVKNYPMPGRQFRLSFNGNYEF